MGGGGRGGGGGGGWEGVEGGDGIDLSGQRTQVTWSMKELILALCVTLDSSFTQKKINHEIKK